MNIKNLPYKISIQRIYKLRRGSYLRSIIRGYRYLKNKNNLSLIWKFKRDLTNTKLKVSDKIYDKFFFINNNRDSKEITFRQFILDNYLSSYFNRDILSYFGKNSSKRFIGGYPKEWLDYLSKNKIKVNYFQSLLIWKAKIILKIVLSIFDYFKIIKRTLICKFNINKFKNKTIYIDSVSDHLINSSINGFTNINRIQNIICNSENEEFAVILEANSSEINSFKLNKKKIYCEKSFSSLNSYKKIFELTNWYFKSIIISFFDCFSSNGLRAFLISESLKTKVYEINYSNQTLNYAFFSCSNWIYKPLWTYLAEKLGTNVFFYFYSINTYQLSMNKKDKFENLINYGWESNSWKNYFVWNKFQKHFINLLPNKSNVIISGPILHEDELCGNLSSKIIQLPKKIAIFDISIFRDFLYKTEGMKTIYETPEIGIKFIKDIIFLCRKKNIQILYKKKRSFSKNIHPKYENFISNISESFFHSIEPTTSLNYLFRNANGCISFPFTSTSLIAKYSNIPSCFYDPSGKLIINVYQSHNIETIQSISKLDEWLDQI